MAFTHKTRIETRSSRVSDKPNGQEADWYAVHSEQAEVIYCRAYLINLIGSCLVRSSA